MQIESLKDKYKGQIGFAAGAGPSLHFLTEEQVDVIQQYPVIAANSAIVKFQKAKYFLSDDVGVKNWHYYTDLLPKLKCVKLLYRDKLEKYCNHLDEVILFCHTWWYSPSEKKYNMEGLLLTKDEPIVGARTSMGSIVHFLYIMGCDPIVLLGNDGRFRNNKRYFWQYDGEEKTYRISGTTFNTKTQNIGFDRDAFKSYWTNFAKYNREHGVLGKLVEIIDCSDSNLDCFPKMNLQEILSKYGERKK